MNFFKLINIKKAAMFGLDARITLAVLAVVSLSVSLTREKKTFEEKKLTTEQQIEVLGSKFLKNYEKIIFNGLYTTPSGMPVQYKTLSSADMPGFQYHEDKVIRWDSEMGGFSSSYGGFAHPETNIQYKVGTSTPYLNTSISYNNSIINNYRFFNKYLIKKDYFSSDPSAVVKDQMSHINTQIFLTMDEIAREEGVGIFGKKKIGPELSMLYFKGSRFAIDRDVYIRFISDLNVDEYSPSDNIVYIILYSEGIDNKLETVIPDELDDIANFSGAQGDDIIKIFNTKDIYARAKAESYRRLEEIKEKLLLIAESNYLDRVSLCSTESTPSASCDLDSDGDFDTDDKNKLVDYNPFPKSSLDTSLANYYKTAETFNYASNTGAQTFLNTTLGLPEYYAYDLFGNVLNYQSNVGLKTKGPYSMEVWY